MEFELGKKNRGDLLSIFVPGKDSVRGRHAGGRVVAVIRPSAAVPSLDLIFCHGPPQVRTVLDYLCRTDELVNVERLCNPLKGSHCFGDGLPATTREYLRQGCRNGAQSQGQRAA